MNQNSRAGPTNRMNQNSNGNTKHLAQQCFLDKKSIKHINNTAELAQGHSRTFPSSEMLHDMRNTKKQRKFPTSEQHHDVR